MSLSWTTALKAQDDSLEAMLARRQRDQNAMLQIAQQTENQRSSRVDEEHRGRALDEQVAWRQANQKTLDEQRTAAAAENQAQAEAIKQNRAQLEAIVNNPNARPELRQAAEFKLAGITPAAGVQTGNDAAAMMERVGANNTAAMERLSTNNAAQMNRTLAVIAGQNLRDANNPTAKGKGGEDLELPGDVQAYIATLPQKVDPQTGRPYTLQRARAELLRQYNKMKTVDGNTRLQLDKANKLLTGLYQRPSDGTMMEAETGANDVTLPDGRVMSFPSPEAAAAFKAKIGQ